MTATISCVLYTLCVPTFTYDIADLNLLYIIITCILFLRWKMTSKRWKTRWITWQPTCPPLQSSVLTYHTHCKMVDNRSQNYQEYTHCLKRYKSRDMTKPTKWLCSQRRLRSAWASAQSDQSLRCGLNGELRTQAFFMLTAKTLIRLGGCPGWSESLLGAHSFCWFCHIPAHKCFLLNSKQVLTKICAVWSPHRQKIY